AVAAEIEIAQRELADADARASGSRIGCHGGDRSRRNGPMRTVKLQMRGGHGIRARFVMARSTPIAELRRRIDRLDDRLLRLLNERAAIAVTIAEQKARTNSRVHDPAREKAVLARVARANRGPLTAGLVTGIFREIVSAARALEERPVVAYFGP